MRHKILTLLISLTAATSAFANCPLPTHVTYHVHEINGHSHGTWDPKYGWYQGSSDGTNQAQDGEHPVTFVKASWFPYLDETHGATNCSYLDSRGNSVTLFQQTGYGDVPPPQGRNWHPDTFDNVQGLSCNTSTLLCQFDFAERT